MVRANLLAQANAAPNTGASNATDFQPPTRNPQQDPVNTQQQAGGVQDASGTDVLSSPNARIEVPVNPAEPGPASNGVSPSGINWPLVLVVTVVLVVIAEFILRRRDKNPAPTYQNSVPVTEATPPTPSTKKAKPKKKSAKKRKKK